MSAGATTSRPGTCILRNADGIMEPLGGTVFGPFNA